MRSLDLLYSRHPDDPSDDDIDVEDVTRLIQMRNQARRKREFRRADRIREKLKTKHHVYVIDQTRTWSTNRSNLSCIRVMKVATREDLGLMGHGYSLYKNAGKSITPLPEDSMHELILERMQCKKTGDFTRADLIQQELIDAYVELDDRKKLWRADGIRFVRDQHTQK
jgi:cysteinyl-tRNA synthetase